MYPDSSPFPEIDAQCVSLLGSSVNNHPRLTITHSIFGVDFWRSPPFRKRELKLESENSVVEGNAQNQIPFH